MLPVESRAPVDAQAWPCPAADGRAGVAVVVKAAFGAGCGAVCRLQEAPPPLEPAERYPAHPATSAPAAPANRVPGKHGCDVWVSGAAQLADGAAWARVELALWDAGGSCLVGPKALWALGDGSPEAAAPALADEAPGRVPLRYELAYGGPVTASSRAERYPPNPVGRGHRPFGRPRPGEPEPRLLWAGGRATRRGAPAGLGPLAAGWAPRVGRQGRLDADAYRRGVLRYRRPPHPQAFNAAPDDQQAASPLRGDETVTLQGLVPGAPPGERVVWRLPGWRPAVTLVRGARAERLEVRLDTLGIEPEAQRLWAVWRGWLEERVVRDARALVVEASSAREEA